MIRNLKAKGAVRVHKSPVEVARRGLKLLHNRVDVVAGTHVSGTHPEAAKSPSFANIRTAPVNIRTSSSDIRTGMLL